MTWARAWCVVPTCDRCGPHCWGEDADTARLPHFATRAEARRILITDWEWQITRDKHGERMLCADCAAAEVCERDGHLWREENRTAELLSAFDPELAGARYRECDRCGHQIPDPAATGRHPESLSAELADRDERMLARLDAELWPEQAR